MTYLLDTMVWIWALDAYERLNAKARQVLEDREGELYLSPVTTWELSIKMQIGRLEFPGSPASSIPAFMAQQGVRPLLITHAHAAKVYELPPLHKDPFDRMLIAQALVENLTLLTADRVFRKYDVPILWAGR